MPITLPQLRQLKQEGKKFSCLTCYDATFAKAFELAQVDSILIGDSLGMVIQGNDSTIPVTIADIVYHTRAVASSNKHALIMADMPFMSYSNVSLACEGAHQLMQAGAHVVKLEGGAWLAKTVRTLHENGIPSCVHLGLTPQSVNIMGGYRLQAKTNEAAEKLLADCKAVVDAGAALLLLECVPTHLAATIQQSFDVPVIGIGAGMDCDGQVLVLHDMLGLTFGKRARFVHDFLQQAANQNIDNNSNVIVQALKAFHLAVQNRTYPQPKHSFIVK